MSNLLRVDMKAGKVTEEPYSGDPLIGGRALISKVMDEEVEATCDPLGPFNKLIIAPGTLGGTTVSCVNRISIGGKSPLTGTIKESNSGGTIAYKLARLGLKGVIVEGLPEGDDLYALYLSKDKSELVPVNDLKDKPVYETAEQLLDKYGKKVGLMVIGPTGEKLYRAAGVANTDNEGRPSRYCARGGLGAVFGSKRLKAVIIDDEGAEGPEIKDEGQFKELRKQISDAILNNEQVANSYTKLGTAGLVNLTNGLGALVTRNFSEGSFEGAENINGQKLYELITERGGEGNPSHSCMPGCLVRCSNIFPDETGKTIVSPIEYETIGLMGSNCGIDSLDTIGQLNYLCNDLGLDTIEMGGVIGVLMEAGVVEFGDGEGALNLLKEVEKDSYLGKIMAAGATVTGKVFGVKRVPVAKDQVLAAYDPRAIKGLGVTYATSPMGGDHTAGQTLRAPVEHTKPEKQVETSRNAQVMNTIHDCIGTCFFVGPGLSGDITPMVEVANSMLGQSYTLDDFKQMAKETLLREKNFNKQAGFNEAHDRLPEFFYTEENPQVETVFDVPDEELKEVHKFD